MRRIVFSLVFGLAVVASSRAQFPVMNAPYPPMGPQYAVEAPVQDYAPYVGPLWTINAEYLLWFLEPARFPTSVVGSTTDPNVNLGGGPTDIGVGNSNYTNVLGPGNWERGPYSGMRLTFSRALPLSFDRCVYTEVGLMWLPSQGSSRRLISSPDGNPAILLPFTNTVDLPGLPAGNFSLPLAGNIDGQRIAGSADALTRTQLWGGEWNLAGPLYKSDTFGMEALVGFRYLGLADVFELTSSTNLGGGISTFDRFSTVNHFYGGQVGMKFLWSQDRWGAMIGSKVALGDTNSFLKTTGNATVPGGTTLPGGFYTASSNLDDISKDRFGVVVDLNASARFALSSSVGISVGYNFLYWSGVMRASDQVSTRVNPTNNAVLNVLFPPGAVPPAAPTPPNSVNDIWAHGLNFGFDIRF